jgi:predicted O-methyltransferase YrrM
MSSAASAFAPFVQSFKKSAAGQRLKSMRDALGSKLAFKPGHFYSPICNPDDLARHYRDPADVRGAIDLPGIDIRMAEQRALWNSWRDFLADYPFTPEPQAGLRYHSNNRNFDVGDATVLYCMLRHLKPKRMIEIGSGYSSACALDTIERFLGNSVQNCFVEPYPALLKSMLKPGDLERLTIVASQVQEVSPGLFEALGANDILFIDSTHIVKTGSDVVHELFNILPRLKPGVIVHFHDVHYPFEYPREWVIERNYSWNEVYALRAFLMYNSAFEIVFFNDAFAKLSRDLVQLHAPRVLDNPGGGLWLRRT